MSILVRPSSLTELFSYEYDAPELIAGGTDWMIARRSNLTQDTLCADISCINELKGIEIINGELRIGASETMTALHKSPLVRRYASALSDAAYVMGSEQIRARATVGGNVANGSPAADTPAALCALDAYAVIVSKNGARRAPVSELASSGKAPLAPGEVIKEFLIEIDQKSISAFMKIGSRRQVSISRVNMAACAVCSRGKFTQAKVFVGTLGAAARFSEEASEALCRGAHTELADALASFAARQIPGRPTLAYKQSALRALAMDIYAELLKRAEEAENNG
ncbi:MAG: FAD binding domain-containing protein [Cloacibacillus sp.]